MRHYIVIGDESIIKIKYTTTLELQNYYFNNEEMFKNDFGNIKLFKNIATLTYHKWEYGKELLEIITSVLGDDN